MRTAGTLGILMAGLALLLAGCGGGDGGGPAPPPPPPPTEIGPGPGPPADVVPDEPGIDTQTARSAPLAAAPTAGAVSAATRSLLEGLVDEENRDSQQDIQDLITALAAGATANRNDSAAQLGLALMMAVSGLYNAALDLGYTANDVFELLDPLALQQAAVTDLCQVQRTIAAPVRAYFFRPTGARPKDLLGKSPIPNLDDPALTTEDVQIAIRNFALPLLADAIARLDAVADNAADPSAPLIEATIDDEDLALYASDFRLLAAALRAIQASLLQLAAYQLNAGSYDWTVEWEDRDGNGDGILSVAEYAPADPFLWRHPCTDMQDAGAALRQAVDDAIWAIENRADGSWLDDMFERSATGAQDALDQLNDLGTLLSGQVTVQVEYNNSGPGAPLTTASVLLNLATVWDDPVDDIKDLLPPLELVEVPAGSGSYQAELGSMDDLPDPTLNGLFPSPDPLETVLQSDYCYMTISYGHIQDMVIVDDVP
jgi:hypothetical protein